MSKPKFKVGQVVHWLGQESYSHNNLETIASRSLYRGEWHYTFELDSAGLHPEKEFKRLTKRERGAAQTPGGQE